MKENVRLFLKFMGMMAPYRRRWFFVLGLSILAALSAAIVPYLSRFVVDEGLLSRDRKAFLMNLGIAAAFFLASEIFKAVRQYGDAYLRARFSFDLNRKFFHHMQHLPLSWFKESSTGENVYRANYDVTAAADFITQILPQAIMIICEGIVVVFFLFYLNWRISFLAFALLALAYLLPSFFGRRMTALNCGLIKTTENVFTYLEEHLSRIFLIKTFARERNSSRGLVRHLIRLLRQTLDHARWEAAYIFSSEAAGKVVVVLISLYGGYEVIAGRMSAGVLTAILAYLYQLVGLYGQAVPFVDNVSVGFVSCRRLAEILEEETEDKKENQRAQKRVLSQGHIVFDRVGFGYRPGQELLKNISFEVSAGEHVALVGPSGCGKTTLLSLLIRFYPLRDGDIMIDGFSVGDIALSSLREQVGFALQESFLWNDTVANNIGYGKRDASAEEILSAGRMSLVDEFVFGLKDGYDAAIGENASKLSEGQKQKIAIARALIKKPKILILDEAMASMDSASEERILANIKREYPQTTLILVSHRLSAVMSADKVAYLRACDEIRFDIAAHFLKHDESFARLFSGQIRGGM